MRFHQTMLLALILGGTLAGCTTPSSTSAPTAATASAPATTNAKPDNSGKLICQTYTPTGSRLEGSKQCLTADEKAKQDEANKRAMRDMENTAPLQQNSPMAPAR